MRKRTTVVDIVCAYLKKHNYDGLCGDMCACDMERGLFPCDTDMCVCCEPGHKVKSTDKNYAWMMALGPRKTKKKIKVKQNFKKIQGYLKVK